MINDRWNDRMDLHDGRRPRTRRSMSHEDHTFETWTDWQKEESRTEANRRINKEFDVWKQDVLRKAYGEDEGHGSK